MMEYIPLVVGAGMFIGSIFAGIWKGKQEASKVPDKKEIIGGVLQDNYSMIMMSEQLRANKDTLERAIHSMDALGGEMERLREYARDISRVLETKIKM